AFRGRPWPKSSSPYGIGIFLYSQRPSVKPFLLPYPDSLGNLTALTGKHDGTPAPPSRAFRLRFAPVRYADGLRPLPARWCRSATGDWHARHPAVHANRLSVACWWRLRRDGVCFCSDWSPDDLGGPIRQMALKLWPLRGVSCYSPLRPRREYG